MMQVRRSMVTVFLSKKSHVRSVAVTIRNVKQGEDAPSKDILDGIIGQNKTDNMSAYCELSWYTLKKADNG